MLTSDLPFNKKLTAVRKLRTLSQTETATILGIPLRLYRMWENGTASPAPLLFTHIIDSINNLETTLEQTTTFDRRSHIYWEKDRGWSTRFTINLGPKRKGKRLRVRLRTRLYSEAVQRFDLLMSSYKQLGLTIHLRTQKNPITTKDAL